MNADAEILDRSALQRLERLGGGAFVLQMIEIYLDYAPQRIAGAEAAVKAGDLVALEQAVHPLRSGSGNLGLCRVGGLAEQIECLARRREGAELGRLVGQLAAAFDEARMSLEEERKRLRR